jgi:transposase-like protein
VAAVVVCVSVNTSNIIEQDHRTVKTPRRACDGHGSLRSAWRTLQGIEAVSMIRKGRFSWGSKGRSGRPGAVRWQPVRNRCLK